MGISVGNPFKVSDKQQQDGRHEQEIVLLSRTFWHMLYSDDMLEC